MNNVADVLVHRQKMSDRIYFERWAVRQNFTIGGWCIMLESDPYSDADGGLVIIDLVLRKDIAHHIVNLHNETVGINV